MKQISFFFLIFICFMFTFLVYWKITDVKAQTCQSGDGVCSAGCLHSQDNDCLSIEDFKASYTNFLTNFGETNRILNFTGTTYLGEFDNNEGVYAGHLGSFWSFLGENSVWSSHLQGGVDRSMYWRNAFVHGLLFYNHDSGVCSADRLISFDNGLWYPSKMKVENTQGTDAFSGKITSIKTGIPGYQGFALKITINNPIPITSLKLSLLSFSMLNSIAVKNNTIFYGNPTDMEADYTSKKGTFQYYSDHKTVVFQNSQFANGEQAYLAIGFADPNLLSSYRLADKGPNLIDDDFCDNGILNELGSDGSVLDGSEVGLATNTIQIEPSSSYTFTIYFVLGNSSSQALNNFLTIRSDISDIEQESDEFWNQRLQQLNENIPHLDISSQKLTQLYINSFLNIPLNNFMDLGENNLYTIGNKTYFALFPWQLAFSSQAHSLADPQGFKKSLKTMLRLDITNCKAINPLNNFSHCLPHAYAPSSMVFGIYNYLTTTKDWGFLSEEVLGKACGEQKTQTVLKWLEELSSLCNYYWPKDSQDGLIDFGYDNYIYEFRGEGCNLRGLYNGKVPSPNAEQYMVHKILSEIYQKLGDESKAQAEKDKAFQTKQALNKLWNEDEGWFDTIALYDENNVKRTTPLRNTFRGVWMLHFLDFPGLLTVDQKNTLLDHLWEYEANYGLNAISILDQDIWCERKDYHGPGLYVGDTAWIIWTLFQNNKAEKAYELLKKVDFMANASYFAQCMDGDRARFSETQLDGCGATAYLDSSTYASVFTKGLFGVHPQINGFLLQPVIPQELLVNGLVTLSNLKIGQNTYEIVVDSNQPKCFRGAVVSKGTNNYLITVPNNSKFHVVNNIITRVYDQTEVKDIVALLKKWFDPLFFPADLNCEGKINSLDFGEILNILAN